MKHCEFYAYFVSISDLTLDGRGGAFSPVPRPLSQLSQQGSLPGSLPGSQSLDYGDGRQSDVSTLIECILIMLMEFLIKLIKFGSWFISHCDRF